MRLPRFPAAACSSLLHRDSELIVAKLTEQGGGGGFTYDMNFAPITSSNWHLTATSSCAAVTRGLVEQP